MKTIFTFLLSAAACFGQNVLVNFYPANQPFAGLTNYPAQTAPVAWATNSPGWATNMTTSAYATYLAGLLPSYVAAQSNAQFQAQAPILAASNTWATLYSLIPVGVADMTTRTNTMFSLYASFISGTNTAAGTNAILAQECQNSFVYGIYLRNMLDLWWRMQPGANAIYSPSSDAAGTN